MSQLITLNSHTHLYEIYKPSEKGRNNALKQKIAY